MSLRETKGYESKKKLDNQKIRTYSNEVTKCLYFVSGEKVHTYFVLMRRLIPRDLTNWKPVQVILSESEAVSWEQFNKNATFGGHFIDTHLSKLQGRQYFIIAYQNLPLTHITIPIKSVKVWVCYCYAV